MLSFIVSRLKCLVGNTRRSLLLLYPIRLKKSILNLQKTKLKIHFQKRTVQNGKEKTKK